MRDGESGDANVVSGKWRFVVGVGAALILVRCAPCAPASYCDEQSPCASGGRCELTRHYCYPLDAGAADAAAADAHVDAGPPVDVRPGDAGRADAHPADTGPGDGAAAESAAIDAGAAGDSGRPVDCSVITTAPLRLFPDEVVSFRVAAGAAGSHRWALGGISPGGLELAPDPGSGHPDNWTLRVFRTLYDGGPKDLAVTLDYGVTADGGVLCSGSVGIVIRDERGPYVRNTLALCREGQGYQAIDVRHGYCGAQERPCCNIPDAVANLGLARSDGTLPTDDRVLVATTGTDYVLPTGLMLHGGVGVSCGWDPVSWNQDLSNKTRLRLAGPTRIDIAVVGGAVVENCDIAVLPGTLATTGDYSLIAIGSVSATLQHNVLGVTEDLGAGGATRAVEVNTANATPAVVAITRNEVTVGHASDLCRSVGISISGTAQHTVAGNVIHGASSAAGVEIGIEVAGSGEFVDNNVSLNGGKLRVAVLVDRASGLRLADNTVLANTDSGLPDKSYGIWLPAGAAARDLQIVHNQIAAADATTLSAALLLEGDCSTGIALDRNQLVAGDVALEGGASIGLAVRWASAGSVNTVSNNAVQSGDAGDSIGIAVTGSSTFSRFVHNTVHAGGGISSYGLYFGHRLTGSGVQRGGIFYGNIIDPGRAAAAYHIYEQCAAGGVTGRAHAIYNADFWPRVADGVRISFISTAATCQRDEFTLIDQVNSDSERFPFFASFSEDPLLAADAFHLLPGSPMRNRADATYNMLSGIARDSLLDIDGVLRPVPNVDSNPDVGCDEID